MQKKNIKSAVWQINPYLSESESMSSMTQYSRVKFRLVSFLILNITKSNSKSVTVKFPISKTQNANAIANRKR